MGIGGASVTVLISGGFCGGYCGYWYWGEVGLRWWGLDLQVVGGIDSGFG